MMGESYNSRPKCCKCGHIAAGRICYAGFNDKVVDNPFCTLDFTEVYSETGKLLDESLGTIAVADWILIQKWNYSGVIPKMPQTYAELMSDGEKR